MGYVSNSDVIQYFESIGVKLDVFYQLLWKHVFVVELLRYKFSIRSRDDQSKWRQFLDGIFEKKDQRKKDALEYLEKWGNQFWQETEYRIRESTEKFEADLKASLGAGLSPLEFSASSATKLSSEQKLEQTRKAQKVVNEVQIQHLARVIEFLRDDVFQDQHQKFFVVIDRLDENWVDDSIRSQMIRALIETIRSFQKIGNVKIVIAMRYDLLLRVIHATRDSGFQEEKYESLYLKLNWSKQLLRDLLDRRVAHLVRDRYTKSVIGLNDVFPSTKKADPVDYILERTLLRPRDAILFVNGVLARAVGRSSVTMSHISQEEGEYSKKRLRSLNDEWLQNYPCLNRYEFLLKGRSESFRLSEVSKEEFEKFVVDECADEQAGRDPILLKAKEVFEKSNSMHGFLVHFFLTLFDLNMVGIKTDSMAPICWSYLSHEKPSEGQVKPGSVIYIHPIFFRGLGIKTQGNTITTHGRI